MVKRGDKRKMERRKNGKINILMIAVAVVLLLSLNIFNVSATADKGIPKVVDYKILHDVDYDWYSVVGEVINPTNNTIYCISVTGRLYDRNGIFLEEDTDEAYLEYVEPNQTVPFKLSFLGVDGTPKTCEFSLKWNEHEVKGLEILDSMMEGNKVRGIIKNNGNETIDSVIVAGIGYNKWGEAEDVDDDIYLSNLPLDPGEKDDFLLYFVQHTFGVASYNVQAEGTAWDTGKNFTNVSKYIHPQKGGRLTLLSKGVSYEYKTYSWGSSIWTTYIKGEIKNVGNEPIYCAKAIATTYYKSDYGLTHSDIGEGAVLIKYLAPGQKAPFLVTDISFSSTPTDYEINEIKWNKRKAEGLEILDSHIELSSNGYYIVIGNITNNGSKIIEKAKVIATFYDDEGKIIEVYDSYDATLLRGEDKQFEIRMFKMRIADKYAYKLQVEGETWESSLRD